MIGIRTIAVADAEVVRKLSYQLGYEISIEETIANIRQLLSSNDHVAFVAVQDDKIVGWVHAFKSITIESRPFIELAGLVVDENFRGQGIGQLLIAKIKEWCVENKLPTLRVRSNVKRKEAHRFYISLGFKEIKEQKVFQIEL